MSDIKLNVYKLGMINLADSAASDLSAQCPDFGPRDRVLFPGDNFELHDLEPVEQKNGTTTYKLTGKDAQMILRKPLEISPEEFPTLLVETWTEPWIVDYRDLGIQIKEPRRETGRTILLPSRQDGKFHRYAFDLRRKSLKPGERITLIDFKPVRQRYESYGETVALRRISLSRVPLPPPDR
jgi:hypothetical protein